MIVGLLFTGSLNAQHLKAKNESIISDKDVTCMASDQMGRLWFGTASGEIFIFSGQSVRKFNQGLLNPLHEISEIGFTNEGQLFGGADQTFFFIDPASDELSSRKFKHTINDVIDVGNNAFLVGTTAGLYSINVAERKMEHLESTSEKSILEIVGYNNSYFFRTNESIHEVLLDKDRWQTEKLDFPFISPTDIFLDYVGALWIATSGKGIFKFQHNQWTKLDEFNGLLDNNVREVYNDDSNSLWVLYDNGFLDIISGNLGNIARLQPGLDIDRMTNTMLGMDQYGSMWVRNNFGNIQRIYQTAFTEIKDRRGNSYRNNNLLHLKGDQLYGMASGNRFWRYQNGFIQEFSLDDIGNQIITDFQIKSNGEIAATTQDGELLLISRFNNVKLDSSSGIKPGPIDQFIYDNRNNILFSKDDQIGFLNPAGEIRYNTFSKEAIKAIIENEDRGVYVIAGHTLYSCDDVRIKAVKQIEQIRNTLLFDVNANGLFMYDGQKLFRTSLDSGDLGVHLIADSLLLGAQSLHLSEDYAVLVGISELQCIDLNSDRRKIIHEINGNSIFIKNQNSDLSLDGEMWLASNNGIHSFWVRDIFEAEESKGPELTFADIQVSYRSICSEVIPCFETDEYEFPSFENDISFSLEGIDLNHDSEISYRWKMEGSREEWSPYASTNEISFTDLNPGSYRVLVMAKNQDNLESHILKSPLIVINPYWWQRPLVRWGALGLSILILSLIINNRYRMIKKNAAEERDKLILEKKMLQYEQQALQLQLNPHFIFNALNNIQGRLSEFDTKAARLQLAKFATLMRQILENSRRPWIPIKDEIATLENYMKVEQFARPELFIWSLDWTDEIDIEEDMIPPMMIQPFIENAIIHGFRSIDYQGHIKVSFSKVAKRVLCQIDDNGVGLVKSSKEKKKDKRSLATQVIRERLASLDPHFAQERLIIQEKQGKDGNGGVSVVLKIPLKNQFN